MKLRTVLLITLALTAINGGFLLYRHLQPPPTPPVVATAPTGATSPIAPTDRAPVIKITPQAPPTTDKQPSSKTPPDRVATLETKLREPPLSNKPPYSNTIADWVLVEKKERRLTLFHGNKPLKSYDIALGQQPEGPKRFAGDNKTPEGRYIIDSRKKNSSYHRALHISYPNSQDVALAAREKRSPGGSIMIHGLPKGMGYLGPFHRLRDWTAGCIAVTNAEIEEIWRAVPNGVPIEIRP